MSILKGTYRVADYEHGKKLKGDPWKTNFFCWLTKDVGGGSKPSKTLPRFFNQQETKIFKSATLYPISSF